MEKIAHGSWVVYGMRQAATVLRLPTPPCQYGGDSFPTRVYQVVRSKEVDDDGATRPGYAVNTPG